MTTKYFSKLNAAGDTIIEVLIVVAVLGLAFSISSATASRGLAQSRNAEEHSQALGLLSSQLELMRSAVNQGTDVFSQNKPFCIDESTKTPVFFSSATVPADLQAGNGPGQYPTACNPNGGFYFESIAYDAATGSFQLRTRWTGANGLGDQEEKFVYRIRQQAADAGTGVSTPASTGQVTVRVQPLQPGAGGGTYTADPTCGDAVSGVLGGAGVSLQQTNGAYPGPPQTTGAGSFTVFSNLTYAGVYKATVNSLPVGWDACNKSNPATLPVTSPAYPMTSVTNSYTYADVTMKPHAWWAYGSNNSCRDIENYSANDGHNGCNPPADVPAPANAEFSRRNVAITYGLNAAMNNPAAAPACLRIGYQQYQGANTKPPPGYPAFTLAVKVNGVATSPASVSLPIEDASAAAWNPHYSGCLRLQLPAGATQLELDWTNNSGSGVNTSAGDPDLQINSVQLYYTGTDGHV